MMTTALLGYSLLVVAAIAVLVKSADYFVDAARDLGLHLRLPSFIVGVTLVAMGTSLPELVSSLAGVVRGEPSIVVGNVIGSNIANIALIWGIAAIMAGRINLRISFLVVDLPFFIGSALLLVLALWDRVFSVPEAALFIAAILIYLVYTATTRRRKKEMEEAPTMSVKKGIFLLLLGGVGIYFGADYSVYGVIELSKLLGVGTETLAMTVMALGTSLPELTVTVVAARRGHPEISLGNVIGSNIFNTFVVMGIPGLWGAITISPEAHDFSLPMMAGLSFLFFFVMQGRRVVHWQGWFLLLFYVYFIGKTVGLF